MRDNKLIAEFMGYTNNYFYQSDQLLYHSSWDKLMSVVEKIENIEGATMFNVTIEDTICDIKSRFPHKYGEIKINHSRTYQGGKIESTYQCVVEFIKWYNEKTVSLADSQIVVVQEEM